MRWWAPHAQQLLAVVAATVSDVGELIDANDGFLRLIDANAPPAPGSNVATLFRQPDLATLARAPADADDLVYSGLLTLGEYMGPAQTLRARVWRTDSHLRLLAEYDIGDLERLNKTVLLLNHEYANAQIELVRTNLKLQQREAQILAASLTDPLTGVGNRRRLEEGLDAEIGRVQRTGGTLCAFMADLDHFKEVNDTYGHGAGDGVLSAFGALLRNETRAVDIVTRFGGEEFVVLMPHIELQDATACAERVRAAIATLHIEPLAHPVTASFGVTQFGPGESGDSLLARIDGALYKAKESGRNRVFSLRAGAGRGIAA